MICQNETIVELSTILENKIEKEQIDFTKEIKSDYEKNLSNDTTIRYWKRICPRCKKEVLHKNKYSCHDSHRKGRTCISCMGEKNTKPEYIKKEKFKIRHKRNQRKARDRYIKNKPIMIEKLRELHGQSSCQMCGINDDLCLCYHHKNPSEKKFSISGGLSSLYSFETLLAEIKKCDLLCHNCHLKLHVQGIERLERKKKLMEMIGQTKCINCSCDDIRCLSFHHRDPSEKLFSVMSKLDRKLLTILDEAKKCDILCMNCHNILSIKEKHHFISH